MIYTSYFGNLRNINGPYEVVSICLQPPKWFMGVNIRDLAPRSFDFREYKKNGDEQRMKESYLQNVLQLLGPEVILAKIFLALSDKAQEILAQEGDYWYKSPDFHVVLLCYEKPTGFCHRFVLSEYLNKYDIPVTELNV